MIKQLFWIAFNFCIFSSSSIAQSSVIQFTANLTKVDLKVNVRMVGGKVISDARLKSFHALLKNARCEEECTELIGNFIENSRTEGFFTELPSHLQKTLGKQMLQVKISFGGQPSIKNPIRVDGRMRVDHWGEKTKIKVLEANLVLDNQNLAAPRQREIFEALYQK